MSFKRAAARLVFSLAALVLMLPARSQTYQVLNLGTLGGDQAFPAQFKVGYLVGGSLMADDIERAFQYNAFGWQALYGFGGKDLAAFGVNAKGNTVGLSYLDDDTTEHAIAWQNGKRIDLGTFPNGDYSEAFGNNLLDMVVGNATTTGSYSYHAFLWQDSNGNGVSDAGEMVDLGLLPGGRYSLLNAINDVGQAVGSADTVIGAGTKAVAGEHAILWDSVHGMQDLGTLGGRNGVAWAINNLGQVVGASDTADGQQHAFLWDRTHGMQDLGLLSGYDSTAAYAINDSGQVTGGAYATQTQTFGGFTWDSAHGMRDINSFVPSNLGFHLFNVVNNNQGRLSAAGVNAAGHQDVFLLVPIPVLPASPPAAAIPRSVPVPHTR